MKRLSVLGGVVLLLVSADLTSVAGGGDKDKLDKNDYFPLKVGTTWEYLVGGKKVVVKVAAHETVAGMVCAKLESDSGGVPITEHLTVKDDGVYRVQANGQKVEPPFCVLKLPPKAGAKWENKCSIPGYSIQGTLVISEEKKVKIGKDEFNTILVTASDLKVGGQDAQMKTWYDKDKGMVKQFYSLPGAGVEVTLELDKFTPAK